MIAGCRNVPPTRLLVLTSGAVLVSLVLYLSAAHGHRAAARLPGWLPSSLTDSCDPYAQPGFLNYDPGNAHNNRWTPFRPKCPPPALAASFLKSAWETHAPDRKPAIPTEYAQLPYGPDGRPWIDMEFARGRTVLVFGDSITRFMTDYLCQMAGEPYIEIRPNHTWAPPVIKDFPPIKPEEERVPETMELELPADADPEAVGELAKVLAEVAKKQAEAAAKAKAAADAKAKADAEAKAKADAEAKAKADAQAQANEAERKTDEGSPTAPPQRRSSPSEAEEEDWAKVTPGAEKSHLSHYCYIPGMDFLLIHIMFFGLDETQFWIDKERHNPPYTFEDRLDMVAMPIIEKIRGTTHRTNSAPELTYVHSGMWDIARFVREDLTQKKKVEENLSVGRLLWYRQRARDIMVATAQRLPKSTMKWLSTHYPLRVSAGWFFNGQRPEIKLNRLVELHEAAVSAIVDTDDATPEEAKELRRYGVNSWGVKMQGTEKWQVDDLHPNLLPGGYLWADMMLYDLKKAVGSWWRPRWWMMDE